MQNGTKRMYNSSLRHEEPISATRPEGRTARMVNQVKFVGVSHPEKLAEGPCPDCRAMVELWITGQGLELSLPEKGCKMEPYTDTHVSAMIARNLYANSAIHPLSTSAYSNKHSIKGSFKSALTGFVEKRTAFSVNFKRNLFFIILITAATAIEVQAVYYFWLLKARIVTLDNDWTNILRVMIMLLGALVFLNCLAYKLNFSDSPYNHIDRWMLASSIVVLVYYILSSFVLPLLFLYRI